MSVEKIVLIVHLVTAIAIIGFILIQQGKGAEAGASFGAGASQTVFGSQGSGNFFTRTTAILATIFFITSFGLAIIAKQQANVTLTEGVPVVEDAADTPSMNIEKPASDIPEGQGEIPAADVPDNAGDVPSTEN